MLVKNLVPQLPSSPTGIPDVSVHPLSEEYYQELKQRQEYLHRTIQDIFRSVPAAVLEIHPILVDNFPHKRLSCHVQQEYVTQLLLLCESFPQLQGRIIELIFTKCLELDVDIVIEDSGEAHISAEADEDDEASEFFQLDDNLPHDCLKSVRRRAGMGEEGAMKIRDDVSETAQKLDSILAILLSFIRATQERSQILATTGTDASELPSAKLFKQMLDAFELRVMTTYKAKYVQFALFYSCQLSPSHGMSFPILSLSFYRNCVFTTPVSSLPGSLQPSSLPTERSCLSFKPHSTRAVCLFSHGEVALFFISTFFVSSLEGSI